MLKRSINLLGGIIILLFLLIFGFYWLNYKISPLATVKYLIAEAGSAVGISATVPPNPYNTIAKQLNEKEKELQEKELKLQEKERLLEKENLEKGKYVFGGLVLMVFILFVLILINFYLDFKKRKQLEN